MSTSFKYKVRDPLGKEHEGNVDALSRDDAAQGLKRDGFTILKLDETDEEEGLNLLPRSIKKSEIIYATSQLAIMVETGITLSTALEGIGEQEENPALKAILLDLKHAVESGEDFSTALAKYPKYFDKTFISLVRASEQTGMLGEMLERIAAYLQKEMETRGKVRAAMAYPAVMLLIAVGVTIFLLTFVLPKFSPMFNARGIKLPTATIIMMHASDYLIHYWYLWLMGLGGLIAGFITGKRTEPGRKLLDGVKINMPVLGTMYRKVALSRSVHTLGTMIQCGVPMLESLKLTSEVAGNYYYEETWRQVLDDVTQGNQICDSLAGNQLFPRTLVQMIASGEQTGKLDVVLHRVSDYYDRDVETSLKTATSLIEPIMITVMGVVVGGIAMALLLPIFSLSRAH